MTGSGPPETASERPLIDGDGIRRIARLACLRVDDRDVAELATHLERIIAYVDKLKEVDVEGVEPDLHSATPARRLRADEPREPGEPGGPTPLDDILRNAPDHEGPYFITPKVV